MVQNAISCGVRRTTICWAKVNAFNERGMAAKQDESREASTKMYPGDRSNLFGATYFGQVRARARSGKRKGEIDVIRAMARRDAGPSEQMRNRLEIHPDRGVDRIGVDIVSTQYRRHAK